MANERLYKARASTVSKIGTRISMSMYSVEVYATDEADLRAKIAEEFGDESVTVDQIEEVLDEEDPTHD